MAIDTRTKRAAVVGFAQPWALTLPETDASIDTFDRSALAASYYQVPLTSEVLDRPWLRRTAHIANENVRIRHDVLKLVMETGVGNADDPTPYALLRWSDDAGHTWSSLHAREIGPQGEYLRRVVWRRLGMGRSRVYEVSGSSPVKTVLIDAYLNPQVTDH